MAATSSTQHCICSASGTTTSGHTITWMEERRQKSGTGSIRSCKHRSAVSSSASGMDCSLVCCCDISAAGGWASTFSRRAERPGLLLCQRQKPLSENPLLLVGSRIVSFTTAETAVLKRPQRANRSKNHTCDAHERCRGRADGTSRCAARAGSRRSSSVPLSFFVTYEPTARHRSIFLNRHRGAVPPPLKCAPSVPLWNNRQTTDMNPSSSMDRLSSRSPARRSLYDRSHESSSSRPDET